MQASIRKFQVQLHVSMTDYDIKVRIFGKKVKLSSSNVIFQISNYHVSIFRFHDSVLILVSFQFSNCHLHVSGLKFKVHNLSRLPFFKNMKRWFWTLKNLSLKTCTLDCKTWALKLEAFTLEVVSWSAQAIYSKYSSCSMCNLKVETRQLYNERRHLQVRIWNLTGPTWKFRL